MRPGKYTIGKDGYYMVKFVDQAVQTVHATKLTPKLPPVVIDLEKDGLHAVVRFTPNYLSEEEAAAAFEELSAYNDDGLNDGGNMYGNVWQSERKTIQIGDVEPRRVRVYKYTGSSAKFVTSFDEYPGIKRLRDKIHEDTGYYFNFCLYNSYTPEAKLGWHSDGEKDMVPGEPVISLSLGDPRRFRMRDTQTHEILWDDYLTSGSSLIMEDDTQKLLEHSLWAITTKDQNMVDCGFRINLTFRVMRYADE